MMDRNELFGKLRHDYLECVDLDAAEKDKSIEERYQDIFSFFVLALRLHEVRLARLSLDIIGRYQKSIYRIGSDENDWRGVVTGYAEYGEILRAAGRGEGCETEKIATSFNPFYGTADEMLAAFERIGEKIPSFDGRKEFFVSVTIMTSRMLADYPECGDGDELCRALREYLAFWLEGFWPILEEYGEYYASSFSFASVVSFVCNFTHGKVFRSSFDRAFAFLKKCVDRCVGSGWLDPIMENAILRDSEHAFFSVLGEADRRGIDPVVNCYPGKSTQILMTIFSRGKLYPGTEEGRMAFYDLLGRRNPTREIIALTIHPSYFAGPSPFPLVTAASNGLFDSAKYVRLIGSYNDFTSRMGLTALGYAYLRGDRKAVETLERISLNGEKKDENGNNTLHYLMSLDGIKLDNLVSLVPTGEFFEKNSDGKTPLDYYFSKEKIDFGEYNGMRNVRDIKPKLR